MIATKMKICALIYLVVFRGNIVASKNLGSKINLKKIASTLFNAEWDPKQPSRVALWLPIREDHARGTDGAVLYFKSLP